MKKLLIIVALFCVSYSAAQTCNAASCSAANVQTAINSCLSGGTVVIPACSATTWSTQVSATLTGNVTIQGATACTGGCAAGSGGSGLALNDAAGTQITLADNAAQTLSLTIGSGAFLTLSNISFTNTSTYSGGGGIINIVGTHGQVGFRLHHFGMYNSAVSAVTLFLGGGYGLIDHMLCTDTASTAGVCHNVGGDFATAGYLNWNDATNLGTNQAVIIEDSSESATNASTEGVLDCYYGAKITLRYSIISGNQIGGCHGTDGSYRSAVDLEVYHMTVTNPISSGLFNMRGGTGLIWSNTFNVSGSGNNSVSLEFFRFGEQIPSATDWGGAQTGLNWIVFSATPSSWTTPFVTLNAANYQTTHSYAANSSALDTNGSCNLWTSAGGTTGSTQPTCPGSYGGTVTDNGGVVWVNVGGSTSVSSIGTHGWCAANPDTVAASDATCAALSGGDTAARYLDANGGVYPFRDQPGVGHNQVSMPWYEWLNTGTIPSPLMSTPSSAIVVANRDFYSYTGSFTGTSGVGSGTLAGRPGTCTSGVAYWGTDTNTLYSCGAGNAWSTYYTPYTYPDPLNTSAAAVTSSQFMNGAKLSNGATAQ